MDEMDSNENDSITAPDPEEIKVIRESIELLLSSIDKTNKDLGSVLNSCANWLLQAERFYKSDRKEMTGLNDIYGKVSVSARELYVYCQQSYQTLKSEQKALRDTLEAFLKEME